MDKQGNYSIRIISVELALQNKSKNYSKTNDPALACSEEVDPLSSTLNEIRQKLSEHFVESHKELNALLKSCKKEGATDVSDASEVTDKTSLGQDNAKESAQQNLVHRLLNKKSKTLGF